VILPTLIVAVVTGFQAPPNEANRWVPLVSREGNFVVDFPGKPSTAVTRLIRTRFGQMRVIITEHERPEMTYLVEKVEIPGGGKVLKAADAEALLDFFRDDIASKFNGKVTTQKKLRLDSGAYGRDFTMEGRPVENKGLATARIREYLSNKALYILLASAAPDQDLPEDVGHFFASFIVGTKRTKDFRPKPEPTGELLGTWGTLIDPDHDCMVKVKGETLEVGIPNTHHDLNADNDKLNAPRILREVNGDFTIAVKVGGDFKPSAVSTNPKAVPYIGGGIVVWQDSNNYIFLGRAGINRRGRVNEFAAFEEREWGTRGALNNRGIEPGGVFLRIERRGNRILGSTSKNGESWTRLDPMETSYPSTIKVGLYAINGCNEPATIEFQDFKFSEGTHADKTKRR
jgi:regulation of enolase protein 1 (concanavalin A-like superfamily)